MTAVVELPAGVTGAALLVHEPGPDVLRPIRASEIEALGAPPPEAPRRRIGATVYVDSAPVVIESPDGTGLPIVDVYLFNRSESGPVLARIGTPDSEAVIELGAGGEHFEAGEVTKVTLELVTVPVNVLYEAIAP